MDNTISSSVYISHVTIENTTSASESGRSALPVNNSKRPQHSDNVSLSSEAISRNTEKESEDSNEKTTERSTTGNSDISSDELREIQKLQQRDAEVKAHEQAHLSAAGQHSTGGASFTYTNGPDGKRYATGGEVPIDLSKEKDPQATLLKMTQVRRAALAPANPSAADRNIAARASMIAAEAMSEINNTSAEDIDSNNPTQLNSQENPAAQIQTVAPPVDSRTSANPENIIPSHTRHMVLQAYAAQS